MSSFNRLCFLLCSTLLAVSAHSATEKSGRIVGGSEVQVDTYPWFTMLGFNAYGSFWRQYCAGALISSEWILSAAHCVNNNIRNNGVVKIGAFKAPYMEENNGGQYMESFNLTKAIIHPENDFSTDDNDFALLKIDGASTIDPVGIDSVGISNSYKTDYDSLWAVGHGRTSEGGFTSDDLLHVNVKYISNEDCVDLYDYDDAYITSNMMCAKDDGKDACNGDSGGPFYDSVNNIIVGVVSWGIGCARDTYPGVYARIYSQFDWIKDVVCNDSASPPSWCEETPSTCFDSTLRFRVELKGMKRFRDCVWVANKPKRCWKPGVKSLCRSTCGQCSKCTDTSAAFKVTRPSDGKKMNKTCQWATPWRCKNIDGVSEACPSSCGICS